MEPGKVNRLAKYGRRTINVWDVFLTAPESTAFFRDYAFNENKSLVQKVSAGHRKVWECTSDVCQWQVTLSKKSKAKRANTKKSLLSPQCMSSLVQGLSRACKRVAASVQTIGRVNVDHRQALIYRAISRAKKMAGVDADKYDKLPSFLRSFERQNPWSRQRSFIHAFLCVDSIVAAQENWVPVLECDEPTINGVCVLLVGKDGDWTNIPVAIAFIYKETAENFECFFANCLAAGIKMDDRALFTDRGKQREAQLRLQNRRIAIHLKFCALNNFFNVCGHFRAVDPNIETLGLEYESVLDQIRVAFPVSRKVKVNGNMENQAVDQYLRKTHPTSWTKFGNGSLTPEEASAIASEWKAAPAYGVGCPLFAGRATSAIEGQNHALLLAGIRNCQVFGALTLFCNMVVETLAGKKTNASNWMRDKHTAPPPPPPSQGNVR
ncbi:hypothetical protein GQ600_11363 [Phytophthora cactorum]|nr:hypothetical protein GQ600_11363 [Phytophthora cactorum]